MAPNSPSSDHLQALRQQLHACQLDVQRLREQLTLRTMEAEKHRHMAQVSYLRNLSDRRPYYNDEPLPWKDVNNGTATPHKSMIELRHRRTLPFYSVAWPSSLFLKRFSPTPPSTTSAASMNTSSSCAIPRSMCTSITTGNSSPMISGPSPIALESGSCPQHNSVPQLTPHLSTSLEREHTCRQVFASPIAMATAVKKKYSKPSTFRASPELLSAEISNHRSLKNNRRMSCTCLSPNSLTMSIPVEKDTSRRRLSGMQGFEDTCLDSLLNADNIPNWFALYFLLVNSHSMIFFFNFIQIY
ncbi:unnamed protein product [Protopolystoma xenopodis]|uniref:Uncharacterized protein n=1 Tax=Protopolystoma xenopodis TaxID=117903 RepID=A0A448WF36_9PLAT|nr:unnamed protein product [Protopolystoma xenopodis]